MAQVEVAIREHNPARGLYVTTCNLCGWRSVEDPDGSTVEVAIIAHLEHEHGLNDTWAEPVEGEI